MVRGGVETDVVNTGGSGRGAKEERGDKSATERGEERNMGRKIAEE